MPSLAAVLDVIFAIAGLCAVAVWFEVDGRRMDEDARRRARQ